MPELLIIAFVAFVVFVFNIPFGYWRAHVKKFSLQWVLAIHIPVPFIILLRIFSGIGFAWYTYIFMVAAFFMGQRLGGLLIKRVDRACHHVTSCLVMDLYHCIHH